MISAETFTPSRTFWNPFSARWSDAVRRNFFRLPYRFRSFMTRSISRLASRRAMSSRLSCSFFCPTKSSILRGPRKEWLQSRQSCRFLRRRAIRRGSRLRGRGKKLPYRFRSFMTRSISRFASLLAISSRLSCSFLPLHRPSSSLTREPLKYRLRGMRL